MISSGQSTDLRGRRIIQRSDNGMNVVKYFITIRYFDCNHTWLFKKEKTITKPKWCWLRSSPETPPNATLLSTSYLWSFTMNCHFVHRPRMLKLLYLIEKRRFSMTLWYHSGHAGWIKAKHFSPTVELNFYCIEFPRLIGTVNTLLAIYPALSVNNSPFPAAHILIGSKEVGSSGLWRSDVICVTRQCPVIHQSARSLP